jgi:hypothetical protein
LNNETGRGTPIVWIQSAEIAHVVTLDCESFNVQVGNYGGNWHEVQRMGRCITLSGRPACAACYSWLTGLNGRVRSRNLAKRRLWGRIA